jgi:hypothetical protein
MQRQRRFSKAIGVPNRNCRNQFFLPLFSNNLDKQRSSSPMMRHIFPPRSKKTNQRPLKLQLNATEAVCGTFLAPIKSTLAYWRSLSET